MSGSKPIIGIAGGVGSGKSVIASLFGELGCCVIDADAQVRALYLESIVKDELRRWWGDGVFMPSGEVDKPAVCARGVFNNAAERQKLEGFLHPLVNQRRARVMEAQRENQGIRAFVWDTPLLFETGLNRECDATVFVDAPLERRLERVAATRGWSAEELARREKLQMPLDRKLKISDYVICNTADMDYARNQVKDILSRICDGLVGHAGRV